jgi:UPF0755 protein
MKERNKSFILPSLIVFIFLVSLILVEFFILKNFYEVLFKPYDASGKVEVIIPESTPIKEVAKILEEKKVIKNSRLFQYYIRNKKQDKNIKSGEYEFDINSSYAIVIEKLIQGPPQPEKYTLTIPEGYTLYEISEKVEEITSISKRTFICNANVEDYNYEFLNDVESLEGFLFPKTYNFLKGTSAHDIINEFLKQFKEEIKNLDFNLANEKNLTIKDIIIISSLIEREVYIPEERELVAAVIYNRLEKDMPLAIDATIRYALNKWDDELTQSDLSIESPYNTRIYKGLPPTPICNPGIESIKAALNPADVDYLYFVVDDEQKHSHFFTNSENEFYKFLNSLEK